jgi:DNA-binding beta-propeller fold protein YncE
MNTGFEFWRLSMLGFRPIFPLILILLYSPHPCLSVEFIREIGNFDKNAKQHQLNAPRAIALAGEKIYIADTDAHRVLVFDLDGKTVLTWGSKGDKSGQFKHPAGIAIDEQGRVYVADTGNHRIQIFDAGGRMIRSFGAKGSSPREFNAPSGLFAQRGLLYVADTGNSRVQVLSTDGIFLRQIEVKAKKDEMTEPVAVAADVQNRIYVLDADANRVRIFDHGGEQLERFGSQGKGTAGFDNPQGLAVDNTGAIYIADTGNYKLKKFDQQGRLVSLAQAKGPASSMKPWVLRSVVTTRCMCSTRKNTLQIFACERNKPFPQHPPAVAEFVKENRGK